ncbi:MAG: hypothetical protein AAFZ15_13870 [Bacteroidota bacterium]
MKLRTLKYFVLGTVTAVLLAFVIYSHQDSKEVSGLWNKNGTPQLASLSILPQSTWHSPPDNGISPANIVHFEAERMGTETVLNWDAVDELNLVGFQVERSCGDQPFERIGWVYSREISHKPNYDFTDRSAHFDESCLYRLKMVDFGGESAYSPAVQVPGAKF